MKRCVRSASIIDDNGLRCPLKLRKVEGGFKWFIKDTDEEVGVLPLAPSIPQAMADLRTVYADTRTWGLEIGPVNPEKGQPRYL